LVISSPKPLHPRLLDVVQYAPVTTDGGGVAVEDADKEEAEDTVTVPVEAHVPFETDTLYTVVPEILLPVVGFEEVFVNPPGPDVDQV
jgi:hypothetical protein